MCKQRDLGETVAIHLLARHKDAARAAFADATGARARICFTQNWRLPLSPSWMVFGVDDQHANHDLNQLRRDDKRGDLNQAYKTLASSATGDVGLLYRDDLLYESDKEHKRCQSARKHDRSFDVRAAPAGSAEGTLTAFPALLDERGAVDESLPQHFFRRRHLFCNLSQASLLILMYLMYRHIFCFGQMNMTF